MEIMVGAERRVERITLAGAVDPSSISRAPSVLLREGEAVHRELRSRLGTDYLADMEAVFADGARLTQLAGSDGVCAVALWRIFQTTYSGRRLEIDDLVTAAAARSRGYGAVLLRWLETKARDGGCEIVTLNSAMHRSEAHRFYDREGYARFGVHFSKGVPPGTG